jgi:hypothetical protein
MRFGAANHCFARENKNPRKKGMLNSHQKKTKKKTKKKKNKKTKQNKKKHLAPRSRSQNNKDTTTQSPAIF